MNIYKQNKIISLYNYTTKIKDSFVKYTCKYIREDF